MRDSVLVSRRQEWFDTDECGPVLMWVLEAKIKLPQVEQPCIIFRAMPQEELDRICGDDPELWREFIAAEARREFAFVCEVATDMIRRMPTIETDSLQSKSAGKITVIVIVLATLLAGLIGLRVSPSYAPPQSAVAVPESPATWSDEQMRAWVLAPYVSTPERMEIIFDECHERSISEAIPKATLYAVEQLRDSDGVFKPHVAAARRYLTEFSLEEIFTAVRKDAGRFTDPDMILKRLQEVLQ